MGQRSKKAPVILDDPKTDEEYIQPTEDVAYTANIKNISGCSVSIIRLYIASPTENITVNPVITSVDNLSKGTDYPVAFTLTLKNAPLGTNKLYWSTTYRAWLASGKFNDERREGSFSIQVKPD